MIKKLRNHSVLSDGAVFKHLRLIPQSMMLIGQRILLHNWKGLLKIKLLYKPKNLDAGTTYLLVHNAYQGYYHWLLESLPRLLEARTTIAKFTLLLPATCTAEFYNDTLRLLDVTQVVYLEPGIAYKVPDLVLAYSEVTMGCYESSTLQCLRETLLKALPDLPIGAIGRKLYISRKLATRRKILNEDEVAQALVSHGFEVVYFENYTFPEQLALCAAAETIVGMHGAGLANMVFQPVGARVIELRKYDNGENIFFSELAHTLGLKYQLLYCKAQNEQALVQDADLFVDTHALLALLT
jgi:capsular polysaccharide biosynthesis protein